MTVEHPIQLDILYPYCAYTGPAPLSLDDGPRVVTCPECRETWRVETRESGP